MQERLPRTGRSRAKLENGKFICLTLWLTEVEHGEHGGERRTQLLICGLWVERRSAEGTRGLGSEVRPDPSFVDPE